MKLLRRILVVVVGPLAVASLLALVSAPPVASKPPSTAVEVTNTPLPVTGSINVANSPDVNVANSPTVKVGNGPAEPIPVSGNLNAMLAGPVQAQQSGAWNVRMSNEQTDTPYNERRFAVVPEPINGGFTFNVPTGQRLIIETVSIYGAVASGASVWGALKVHTSDSNDRTTFLSATFIGVEDLTGRSLWIGTHPITAWADSDPSLDAEVSVTVVRTLGTGQATMNASVNGHLVPLP